MPPFACEKETLMTDKNERQSPGLNHSRKYWMLAWGVPCLIFAFLMYMVFHYAVDAPYYDQWLGISLFVKAQRHELTWMDVWAQHNEHRILLPNLIILGLARWSGWNIRWELATSLILGIGIYAVYAWQIERTATRMRDAAMLWLLPVIAVAVFSLRQYENWLWGFQLCMFLNVLMVTMGFALLTRRALTWTTLLAALACGLGATFSFGNGLLYWPLGLALLFMLAPKLQRRQFLIAWIVTALLTVIVYFHGYSTPPNAPPLQFLRHLLKSVVFFVAYLGSFSGGVFGMYAALAAGSIGLALFSMATWRLLRNRQVDWKLLMPYWASGSYALASGLLTILGRSQSSVLFSLTSRYTTISELFWISTLILTYLWLRQSARQPEPDESVNTPSGNTGDTRPAYGNEERAASDSGKVVGRRGRIPGREMGALAAFGVVFVCASLLSRQNFQQWHDTKIEAQQRLLTEPLQPDRQELYSSLLPSPWTYVIFEEVPVMKQYHLGIFRNADATQKR